MARVSKEYKNWIKVENEKSSKEFSIYAVGKPDPKRHLQEHIDEVQDRATLHNFGLLANVKAF